MKPIAFDYFRPDTLQAALAALDDAKALLVAGAHTLLPKLNERVVTPSTVIDISRLAELKVIDGDANRLQVGAAATLNAIRSHAATAEYPLLRTAIDSTGNPAVRSKATLAGNLANASPSSELPVAVAALDARLLVTSAGGSRAITAAEFFTGPHTTSLRANEIIVAIEFPKAGAVTTGAFVEIVSRHSAPPLACVAAVLAVDETGRVTSASIVAGGISGYPSHCPNTEAALLGKTADQWAGAVAAEMLVPHAAVATAGYAADVLPVLIRRALQRAAADLHLA